MKRAGSTRDAEDEAAPRTVIDTRGITTVASQITTGGTPGYATPAVAIRPVLAGTSAMASMRAGCHRLPGTLARNFSIACCSASVTSPHGTPPE